MKSVLISIKPKWCELIASGKKTIEVRKTRPKCDTPFKCYIYCTSSELLTRSHYNGKIYVATNKKYQNELERVGNTTLSGKVIGEFVCNKIDKIDVVDNELMTYIQVNSKADMFVTQETCLEIDELQKYLDNKTGWGWHISHLVIYDKPKELSDFSSNSSRLTISKTEDSFHWKWSGMTRPPQSWCYAEELEQ